MSYNLNVFNDYLKKANLFKTEHPETNYGKEVVVSDINCSGNLRLNETTVEGSIHSDQSIRADHASLSKAVTAGNNIDINDTIAASLNGEDIIAVESEISGAITAGGSVTANRCKILGVINAEHSVSLDECPIVQSISTGASVTLLQSIVQGNVSAQGTATINGSTISDKLTCRSNKITIEGSNIDTIHLLCSTENVFGGSVSFHAPGALLINSSIQVSGGNLYIGNTRQRKNPSQENQEQVLVLRNCTVRNIIFEGGNGQVTLEGESILKGNITGGTIRS